jgi:hypothetical protein
MKGWISQRAYQEGWELSKVFGIVWGNFDIGAHAKNWLILEDIGLVFFEPQTEEIQKHVQNKEISTVVDDEMASTFFVGGWTSNDRPWVFIA